MEGKKCSNWVQSLPNLSQDLIMTMVSIYTYCKYIHTDIMIKASNCSWLQPFISKTLSCLQIDLLQGRSNTHHYNKKLIWLLFCQITIRILTPTQRKSCLGRLMLTEDSITASHWLFSGRQFLSYLFIAKWNSLLFCSRWVMILEQYESEGISHARSINWNCESSKIVHTFY